MDDGIAWICNDGGYFDRVPFGAVLSSTHTGGTVLSEE